eukprot:3810132-Rhodomonas_salina.2
MQARRGAAPYAMSVPHIPEHTLSQYRASHSTIHLVISGQCTPYAMRVRGGSTGGLTPYPISVPYIGQYRTSHTVRYSPGW